MITLLWPHWLLTAVRNLKALSSAVLSFSLTSRLSSVPYSFALYLKSRWRGGQTHVVFFVVFFTSWHFTLISPPAIFLWCLASINDAISSLTEFEKKKRRKTFSHHHLSDLPWFSDNHSGLSWFWVFNLLFLLLISWACQYHISLNCGKYFWFVNALIKPDITSNLHRCFG